MKIWAFLKWQWRKWEIWQRWFAFMAFLFGVGAATSSLVGQIALGTALMIFFYFITKWWIVDPVRKSYEEFKKEKDNLFDTIKNSDKK